MLTQEPNLAVGRIAADGALSITLSGAWTLRSGFPSAGPIAREIATRRPRSLVFDVRDLGAWDSALVTFLRHLDALCARHQVAMRRDALPVGVQRLLALAEAVPEKPGVRRTSVHTPWIARLGTTALDLGAGSVSAVAFVGEVASATWQLMRRSARFRIGDLAVVMQECGVQALPIVTLISILVGIAETKPRVDGTVAYRTLTPAPVRCLPRRARLSGARIYGRLLFASLVYLPVVLAVMALDKLAS